MCSNQALIPFIYFELYLKQKSKAKILLGVLLEIKRVFPLIVGCNGK
jgi:hypothetical protein